MPLDAVTSLSAALAVAAPSAVPAAIGSVSPAAIGAVFPAAPSAVPAAIGAAAPATALVDSAVGWLQTLVLLVSPGVVAAVLWSPVLLSARLRALFAALPPAGRPVVSYVAVAVGLSVPYLAGLLLTVLTVDPEGAAWGNALIQSALAGGVAVAVVAPAVAAVGLPRLGVDWDPTGYGLGTWATLVAAGAWYALVAGVPLVALAVVVSLPGGY